MKRIVLLSVVAMIAMIGSASATVFSSELRAYDGSEITDFTLQVGVPFNLSIYLEGYQGKNVRYEVNTEWTSPEMEVDIRRESIYVDSNEYTDNDALTILIPKGTEIKNGQAYTVYIDVFRDGAATNQIIIKASSSSAEFEAIPEFPTVALPIAAILGLAFLMQRRKEE